jgi:outer membrane immunogenic protein
MKTLLKATVATIALLGGGAALAADLPSSKMLPLAPALPQFYSWTGFYLGGQLGYSWGSDRLSEFLTAGRTPLGVSFDYSPSSFVGGVHAGFNYQMGSFVFGVEADVEAMNARGGFNDPPLVRSPFDPGGIVRVQQDWQASVRARIGYAFDRFMVYGTAGAAFTKFEHSYFNPLAGFGESGNFSRTGWTVGGGVNYAMTDNLILGLDYRYTDYGNFDYVARSAYLGLTAQHEPYSHAARASLAYKF